MIINENNKNSILQGTFKRGFNQDPAELRAKLHPNAGKIEPLNKEAKPISKDNGNLKRTFNTFRNLKWKYPL